MGGGDSMETRGLFGRQEARKGSSPGFLSSWFPAPRSSVPEMSRSWASAVQDLTLIVVASCVNGPLLAWRITHAAVVTSAPSAALVSHNRLCPLGGIHWPLWFDNAFLVLVATELRRENVSGRPAAGLVRRRCLGQRCRLVELGRSKGRSCLPAVHLRRLTRLPLSGPPLGQVASGLWFARPRRPRDRRRCDRFLGRCPRVGREGTDSVSGLLRHERRSMRGVRDRLVPDAVPHRARRQGRVGGGRVGRRGGRDSGREGDPIRAWGWIGGGLLRIPRSRPASGPPAPLRDDLVNHLAAIQVEAAAAGDFEAERVEA